MSATDWNIVLAAGDGVVDALERLWLRALPAVRGYLCARIQDHAEAMDVESDFFQKFQQICRKADRNLGSFRSFTFGCLQHYLKSYWTRKGALKRGGKAEVFSVDAMTDDSGAFQLPDNATIQPDKAFDRLWLTHLMNVVQNQLRNGYEARGKGRVFDLLILEIDSPPTDIAYEEMAGKLGLKPNALRQAMFRLRQDYRRLLLSEISQTVSNVTEFNSEVRELMAIFNG